MTPAERWMKAAISDMDLRLKTNKKLHHWMGEEDNDYILLKKLLGKDPTETLRSNSFTDADRQTCLTLCGPHGYSVFKILCLKRGLPDSPKS